MATLISRSNDLEPVTSVSIEGQTVEVRWTDGEAVGFYSIWLRDNCHCTECRHPDSGQRLLDPLSMPADIAPSSVRVAADGYLEVAWSDHGHVSKYDPEWLRGHLTSQGITHPPILWDASTLGNLPAAQFDQVWADEACLRDWLRDVVKYGFALLRGVPAHAGTIFRVVDLFGFVRETNYGHLFDVRTTHRPSNLAYTGMALGPHTDNPYRDPTPTLQLLHCLSSSIEGGENTLVDGFKVANELRRSDSAAFEWLNRYAVRYRYIDRDNDLSHAVRVISLQTDGEIEAIHCNNRSSEPFTLPRPELEQYYDAYLTFARMVSSPEFQIAVKLAAGDLVIMNNRRILHGRTSYSNAGKRHLQGCYADVDALRSRLAVLERDVRLSDKVQHVGRDG